jgi:undecaprenyl-diphosphatase
MIARLTKADRAVLFSLQSYRPEAVTAILKLITYSGTGWAWFAFAIIVNVLDYSGVHFVSNQFGFLRALIAPLIAWLISKALKRSFGRVRPMYSLEGLKPLIATPTCGSFPSGHAATSTSFFFALFWIGHPLAPAVGVWALLVTFSRLYLGVHYLSDVLGGIAVGISASLLAGIFN